MAIKVLQTIPGTDYTLLDRGTEFQPLILAYLYDSADKTWAQGHCFETIYQVEAYLNKYLVDGYVRDANIVLYEAVHAEVPFIKTTTWL